MLILVLNSLPAYAGACDDEEPFTTCHDVCFSYPNEWYLCDFDNAAFREPTGTPPTHDATITAAFSGRRLYFYGVDPLGSDFCCDEADFETDWNAQTYHCYVSASQSDTYTTVIDMSEHPADDGCQIYGNWYEAPVTIIGTDQDDEIYGGVADHTIFALDGADLIYGGEGNDDIFGGYGNDEIYTGPQAFEYATGTLYYDGVGAGMNYANGEQGHDGIFGGDNVDEIDGGPGNDTVDAGGGNDVVCGGTGIDSLNGEGGDDYLWGGAGIDHHHGGLGGTDRCESQFKLSCEGTDTTSCPIIAP